MCFLVLRGRFLEQRVALDRTTGRSVMTTVGAVQTSTGQVHFGCLSDHQLAGKSTVFHRRRLVSTVEIVGKTEGSEIVLRSSGSVLRPFGAP